jgi:hypothetical protein
MDSEKQITVRIDGIPTYTINITKKHHISDLKNGLKEYSNYAIQMFLNSETMLPIFNTDQYDNFTFESVWKQMDKPVIVLNKLVNQSGRVWSKIADVDKKILIKLSYKDLLSTCTTNTYLSNLCKDPVFWRNKISRDFPNRGKYVYYTEYQELYRYNPRKLYEIINRPSKIVTLSTEEFPELPELVEMENELQDTGTEPDLNVLSNIIYKLIKELPLLKGDVIFLGWSDDYRNEGKYIWNGTRVNALDSNIDEYGSVPSEFTFPEFPLDHFFGSIDHNSIIWLSSDTMKELQQNYLQTDEKDEMGDIRGKSVITDLYDTQYHIDFLDEARVLSDEKFQEEVFKRKYIDIYDQDIETNSDGSKSLSTFIYPAGDHHLLWLPMPQLAHLPQGPLPLIQLPVIGNNLL